MKIKCRGENFCVDESLFRERFGWFILKRDESAIGWWVNGYFVSDLAVTSEETDPRIIYLTMGPTDYFLGWEITAWLRTYNREAETKKNPRSTGEHMNQQYCLGFAFDKLNDVLLIRKLKPDWQAGFLNGIGGKVEAGESPLSAMTREFREECGIQTSNDDWRFVATFRVAAAEVLVFAARLDHRDAFSLTAEQVVAVPYNYTMHNWSSEGCLPNLWWLIPLASAVLSGDGQTTLVVEHI